MLGQYSSATLVGRSIAPLVGGSIISWFVFYPGLFAYWMVYIAAALAAVPVFIMILMFPDDSNSVNILPFSVFRESFVTFFSNRRLRGTAAVDMATYFAFGAFETFLPVFLLSQGIDAFQTGIIFAIQVLIIAVSKPFFGVIADRVDKRIQIAAGLIIIGCSVTVIPLASSFTIFLVISAIFGMGMSLSTVATSAYIADVAKKEQIGASMGALSSIMDIGQSMGPLITGIIITAAGFSFGFFASFLLSVVITVVFLVSVTDVTDPYQAKC
jgi:MFS family permease